MEKEFSTQLDSLKAILADRGKQFEVRKIKKKIVAISNCSRLNLEYSHIHVAEILFLSLFFFTLIWVK